MLNKLRIRFVIINMTIVIVSLCIIFGVQYASTSQNLKQESIQTMRSIALHPNAPALSIPGSGNTHIPYFSILVNRDSLTMEVNGGFFDLSDKELLNALFDTACESLSEIGEIDGYDLRYLKADTKFGKCIVFADITHEKSTLNNLIQTYVIIGIAAILVFIGISILLAIWAVKPVAKAWKQQKQFVGDASHELKTPLTVIMTDAELLCTSECTQEERMQLSSSILKMSSQMRGLIEGLLDLARLDNGASHESIGRICLSDIASEACMMFEPVFFEKNMNLEYRVEPELYVRAGMSHMKQLIDIFLDNASKYASSQGTTSLTLSKSGSRKCLLDVANEGEPIEKADLSNLFKRFYRADKARSMTHSYGLGLSIAESITEKYHGRIWAESRDGLNHFCVELSLDT